MHKLTHILKVKQQINKAYSNRLRFANAKRANMNFRTT